jgi:hypothetical protein
MTAPELAVILEQRGLRVRARSSGRGFMAQCPAHGDGRHLSLTVSEGRQGRRLMYCFAGCGFDDVRRALGLPHDVFAGWGRFNHQRLGRTSTFPSLTLSICQVPVVDARRLPVRAATGSTLQRVRADLGGLLDAAQGLPVMYSARFGAERVGSNRDSVAAALRELVRDGTLRRGPDIPAHTGRATRSYRRAGR